MTTIRTTRLTLLSLVALGLCGLTLFLFPVVSPAAPTISWTPQKVSEIVAQGESKNIPVSFRSGENLTNVTFRVVPEISPYVSVTPASIASIAKDDETVVVTLSFSPDEDAPIDTFDGTVHVRAGTSARTYAKPLPVTVQILEKLPLAVEPDTEKIVSDPEGGVYPVNQVLMRLVQGAARSEAEEIAASVGGRLVGFISDFNVYQLEVPTNTIPELKSVIITIDGDPSVAAAFTNSFYAPQGGVSTDLDNLRRRDPSLIKAYDNIFLRKAWNQINDQLVAPRRVVVGIADTAIMGAHKEFQAVDGLKAETPGAFTLADQYRECYATSSVKMDPRFDTVEKYLEFQENRILNHGTAVAGVIGASNLSAIDPDSPQMNGILSGFAGSAYDLRSASPSEIKSLAHIGILARIRNWSEDPPQVINMSFGRHKCPANRDSCDLYCLSDPDFKTVKSEWENIFAKRPNILFVAAAGNSNESADKSLPAGVNAENVITIGSTNLIDERSSFSNYGDKVDIAAPGEGVYAPIIYQPSAYGEGSYASSENDLSPFRKACTDGYFCGTSAAAPMVAGVAAMLMSIDPVQRKPEDIPQYIKQVLLDTANEIHPDKQLGCKEKGWGGVV